jgi:hypothetical protein
VAEEEWRNADVPDCKHEYLVSSFGAVKRAPTTIIFRNALTGRINVRELPEKIMAQQDGRHGYKIVSLQLGRGRSKHTLAVAPLVCAAFHGPRPKETHCAHLNGNNQDNRASNLAWVSPSENEAHKVLHGTRQAGERHHQAKLTDDDVRHIRSSTKMGTELAAAFGVSKAQISSIRLGKNWAHLA